MAIKVKADGEPNVWIIFDDKDNWLAKVQFNGEVTVPTQQELLNVVIQALI